MLETEQDRQQWIAFIQHKKLPMSVSQEDGRKRSIEQNRLQRLWMNEAAEQLGEYDAEYYRAYCKAWFGIPIRCEDEDFLEIYNEKIRPLDYETKIAFMARPIDLPVTRDMTVKQKQRYLDKVYEYFSGLGVQLTEPNNG